MVKPRMARMVMATGTKARPIAFRCIAAAAAIVGPAIKVMPRAMPQGDQGAAEE